MFSERQWFAYNVYGSTAVGSPLPFAPVALATGICGWILGLLGQRHKAAFRFF